MAAKKILLDLNLVRRTAGVLMLFIALAGCGLSTGNKMSIMDIKMAPAISENIVPVNPTNKFPANTSRVYCWFKWRNAQVDSHIIAKWQYASQNINILNYTFSIPKQDGSGSVSLVMPKDKTLPSGLYRIDLVINDRTIKSYEFRVE